MYWQARRPLAAAGDAQRAASGAANHWRPYCAQRPTDTALLASPRGALARTAQHGAALSYAPCAQLSLRYTAPRRTATPRAPRCTWSWSLRTAPSGWLLRVLAGSCRGQTLLCSWAGQMAVGKHHLDRWRPLLRQPCCPWVRRRQREDPAAMKAVYSDSWRVEDMTWEQARACRASHNPRSPALPPPRQPPVVLPAGQPWGNEEASLLIAPGCQAMLLTGGARPARPHACRTLGMTWWVLSQPVPAACPAWLRQPRPVTCPAVRNGLHGGSSPAAGLQCITPCLSHPQPHPNPTPRPVPGSAGERHGQRPPRHPGGPGGTQHGQGLVQVGGQRRPRKRPPQSRPVRGMAQRPACPDGPPMRMWPTRRPAACPLPVLQGELGGPRRQPSVRAPSASAGPRVAGGLASGEERRAVFLCCWRVARYCGGVCCITMIAARYCAAACLERGGHASVGALGGTVHTAASPCREAPVPARWCWQQATLAPRCCLACALSLVAAWNICAARIHPPPGAGAGG